MFTKTDIEKYFIAEKQESLLFMIIGAVAIIIALLALFVWKTQSWKGASIPLIAIALIQIVVGYTVYARSDKQRVDMVYAFDMNPDKLKSEELPRMRTVHKNFIIYRWVEIVLIVARVATVFLYIQNADKQFWFGLGLALSLQSATMLTADYFAEKRALDYTKGIESVIK